MEQGLSGAERNGMREDINGVVRQLATLLLRYCLTVDLHQVIAGRKCNASAAVGAADMTVVSRLFVVWIKKA